MRIETPIGFLNLGGDKFGSLLEADQQTLAQVCETVVLADTRSHSCGVLFLYGELDELGRIAGSDLDLRSIARNVNARLLIVASENSSERFAAALGLNLGWAVNIVLTIDRRGRVFSSFMQSLFERMMAGKSLFSTWVELAPQDPRLKHTDAPSVVMAAAGGDLGLRQR